MKNIAGFFCMMVLFGAASCKKDDTPATAEVFTKFAKPDWKVESAKYSATMTAVVALPDVFIKSMGENDQLAAFANGECRSEGVKVNVGTKTLYFLLVAGMPDEQSKISIRYYNATTSYMYQATAVTNFKIDDVYGTAEHPKLLVLEQLK